MNTITTYEPTRYEVRRRITMGGVSKIVSITY
jgi:hypothetical protein